MAHLIFQFSRPLDNVNKLNELNTSHGATITAAAFSCSQTGPCAMSGEKVGAFDRVPVVRSVPHFFVWVL